MADQLVLPATMSNAPQLPALQAWETVQTLAQAPQGWQARLSACTARKVSIYTSAAAAVKLQVHMLSVECQGATEAGSDKNKHYCRAVSCCST